ncbi:MAG: SUMF1/EgtB/PvdO family nonheme iron enzyme [Saprospiraceae bacterium]|jgi:formylglycine-generating enzyme required for sulfatase activity|nr:SUMF1/EgtB/PvdO family nonheme iron enzyme [Saprospiraceae bacterium]
MRLPLLLTLALTANTALAQWPALEWSTTNPLAIKAVVIQKDGMPLRYNTGHLPVLGFELDRRWMTTTDTLFLGQVLGKALELRVVPDFRLKEGYLARIYFKNISNKDLLINNINPFGGQPDQYFIAGKKYSDAIRQPLPKVDSTIPKLFDPFAASADTSRSLLYRPGQTPVEVVLPHNNQDLGFCTQMLSNNLWLYGLARRAQDTIQNYLLIRTPYRLKPGAEVQFLLYIDVAEGSNWQSALRKCFQERLLYDAPKEKSHQPVWKNFDNSLYERPDLAYARRSYSMHLMMAWDPDYFTPAGGYGLNRFLKKMQNLYGGDEIATIWPTWPALGMDQRSQWDLMAGLPGGLPKQRQLAEQCRAMGTRYFISYNPWDDSSEAAGLARMTDMISEVSADGVVLDTKAEAGKALQQAADDARPGVLLYSEGMAVPKDMPGIMAGRVHNDIYHVPLLNLNKLIKPDFAIFRVVEIARERVRREYATALFNGYGVEINVMRPGRPGWVDDDYRFWGRCVRILRENSGAFLSKNLTPLWPTRLDSVYVNAWRNGRKALYTVFSLRPEGYRGPLLEAPVPKGYHCVDLWRHEEAPLTNCGRKPCLTVQLDAFDRSDLHTNNEGAVGALAVFPRLLETALEGAALAIRATGGEVLRIWEGDPAYDKTHLELLASDTATLVFLSDIFGKISGKYVVQLFDKNELMDEAILHIPAGQPVRVSRSVPTIPVAKTPQGMVAIPAGHFTMQVSNGDEFIGYPKAGYPKTMQMPKFYIDKYPVTNRQYKEFLDATGYYPADTSNFLAHWVKGAPQAGEEDFPIVNVSYEDARAYAAWAGKRLPTEAEWQYAAQTADGRRWPWGNSGEQAPKGATKVSATFQLNAVGALDPKLCNPGNCVLYPVGSYPKGANPWGVQDLVGCVWQLTNDWYQSDTYGYILLKGGSYYHPGGSWWYVQGGPRPLSYRQMLLRVSPGFERNGTVGFRCVVDAQ